MSTANFSTTSRYEKKWQTGLCSMLPAGLLASVQESVQTQALNVFERIANNVNEALLYEAFVVLLYSVNQLYQDADVDVAAFLQLAGSQLSRQQFQQVQLSLLSALDFNLMD